MLRALAILVLSTLLLSGLAATPAHAMSMRTRLVILAHSEDGQSVLVEAHVAGPEGGGQDAYQIWSAGSPHRQTFELSSTLSPGDGSRPQHIDAKTCQARLKELDTAVRKAGFKNITVKMGACAARSGYVQTQKRHAEQVAASAFKVDNKKLMRDGYEIRFTGQEIAVMKDDAKLCTYTQQPHQGPVKYVVRGTGLAGKGAKLIYFVEESSDGDEGLFAMCGGTETMKEIPIRD